MSLKYQNSEFFVIHFRINSTGDHTYQKTMHYVHSFKLLCTIKKKKHSQLLASTSASLQTELSSQNDWAPLNRQRIKSNFFKSRYPPIQKALLSQRDIRVSSTYSELYTKTMYKSIEKSLLLYFSLDASNKYLVLWTLTTMHNS